jgi:DNA-directed RNA polymerase specialized sigma24 family protein
LLDAVESVASPEWRDLVSVLWPEVSRLVRTSRAMHVLSRSEDHVRNATVLVLEKLSNDDCRAVRLYRPWRRAHPGKTLHDWLAIVSTNVARDYVRCCTGRAEGGIDKRLLASLAGLLPDDDDLAPLASLSATSTHAARELARWAEDRLPADQQRALGAWLEGSGFDDIATQIAVADGQSAKRVVRAAVAALRRHACAA